MLLFDDAAAARCLAADFDVSRGGQRQVDADAAAFAALIEACGGRSFADTSPNGGRHVYVLWSRPRPITELRPLMRALCARFPSLDPAPMLNPTAGCIRPPGARHRTGGHQQLTTPIEAARAAVATPCGPEVWGALLDRLAPAMADDPPTPCEGPEMPAEIGPTQSPPSPRQPRRNRWATKPPRHVNSAWCVPPGREDHPATEGQPCSPRSASPRQGQHLSRCQMLCRTRILQDRLSDGDGSMCSGPSVARCRSAATHGRGPLGNIHIR